MKNTLKIGDSLMNLTEPAIMGILNVTPDSFYKDSRFNPNGESFLQKATEMVADGVDIFDIGGFSTRPGGQHISIDEEIKRVMPAVEKLKKHFPNIPISIDTFRSKVAETAIDAGVEVINDISGGEFDDKMFDLVIKKKPVYVLMHLQGSLETMHSSTTYADFYPDILNSVCKKANYLRQHGVKDIVIDPGFGFSKTISQNYEMLNHLSLFEIDLYPLLIGMSRKSMIYKLLNVLPEETLISSTFLHGLAIIKGGKILRVHDVKPVKQMIKLISQLKSVRNT